MKKLILIISFLGPMSATVSSSACADHEKPEAAQISQSEKSAPEDAVVVSKANLPRMPASDGSCAAGEIYNATDSTCVSAGK